MNKRAAIDRRQVLYTSGLYWPGRRKPAVPIYAPLGGWLNWYSDQRKKETDRRIAPEAK
ncbi:hypothetical protein LCGC14_0601030 [marine sediment metagenome]|uniref:Uncharacterized protein n=1 Tax=marine sediment metagenome TaxID=412755 RepID=A0A0F9RUM5_9ZZZZ